MSGCEREKDPVGAEVGSQRRFKSLQNRPDDGRKHRPKTAHGFKIGSVVSFLTFLF